MNNAIAVDNKRLPWLDCLRALLIISMVCGHAGSPYNTYIYMMHIPGFFIVSGYASYLSRRKESYHPISYIVRRIKTILIPAFCINICFLAFYEVMDRFGVRSVFRANDYATFPKELYLLFTKLQTADIGGATWFLFVLFEVETIFTVFHCLGVHIRFKWITYVCSLLCGICGYYMASNGRYLPYLLDLAMYAILYYGIGYFMAEHQIVDRIENKTMLPLSIILTLFFGAFWFKGRLPMNWPTRQFADLFIQCISCFASLYLVYAGSKCLSKCKWSNLLIIIGQRTYCILILHFLVFKLLFAGCYMLGINGVSLSYLQNLTPDNILTQHGGWLIIGIMTIAICLLISYGAEYFSISNYLVNAKWCRKQRR